MASCSSKSSITSVLTCIYVYSCVIFINIKAIAVTNSVNMVILLIYRLELQVEELSREMRERLEVVERSLTEIRELAHKIHARI